MHIIILKKTKLYLNIKILTLSASKELFTIKKIFKVVYYQAPTGTGKTISPIGIASSKKVIFTCAANILDYN